MKQQCGFPSGPGVESLDLRVGTAVADGRSRIAAILTSTASIVNRSSLHRLQRKRFVLTKS
jgi:hypothetical protein